MERKSAMEVNYEKNDIEGDEKENVTVSAESVGVIEEKIGLEMREEEFMVNNMSVAPEVIQEGTEGNNTRGYEDQNT